MIEYAYVHVYPTTDTSINSVDNTQLVAISTCPRWGVIRYGHKKALRGNRRAMALEAGSALHEVFAAHRIYSLLHYGPDFYGPAFDPEYRQAVHNKAVAMFGSERWDTLLEGVSPNEDFRRNMITMAMATLETGPFYDDPDDKRRTLTNIEECAIAYIDRVDHSESLPAIMPLRNGPLFVGVEVPIDVTIEYWNKDRNLIARFRLIGRADGVHFKDRTLNELIPHENKTAARLGDAWEMSFLLSHQVTGYILGLRTLLALGEQQMYRARILGVALPLPKTYDYGGIENVPVSRYPWQFDEWFRWAFEQYKVRMDWADDPTNAPTNTHSCNRYFRPCPFIPLCAVPPDEREHIFDNEMVIDEWNPLEEGNA